MSEARFIERPGRRLRLTGEQALWFLDQLVTAKVDDLASGDGAEALLLTHTGKIQHHMSIFSMGDAAFVDYESAAGDDLAAFLASRVFTTRVELAEVTPEWRILRVMGEGTGEVLSATLGSVPTEREHAASQAGDFLIQRIVAPDAGADVWVPATRFDAVTTQLHAAGGRALSNAEYEEIRVPAGAARIGVDFGDKHLPQEAALERAVHFAKGCYLGQEAIAMAQRGKLKRRLRHLRFESGAAAGEILTAGREVGRVTSAAGGFGIGMVATEVPPGGTVEVEGKIAKVEELPRTVEGPSVPSARALRESLMRPRR